MDKWLESWERLYEYIDKKWPYLPEKEQEVHIEHLEEVAESLLDAWTDMDEKLALLKTKLDERHPQIAYQSKGTTYYQLEMFQEATETLEQEQETGEKDELRRLYLAYSYLYIGAMNRAFEHFLYLIQTSQNVMIEHFSYVGLGCYYVQEEKYDEAIDAFEHANTLTTSEDVVYNLGICHYVTKSFHVAKQYFSKAIQMLPEDGEAYFFLGCCHWKIGHEEQAFSTWMECLQLLNTPYALQALAYVCEWHGHHLAAVHCYKRMIAIGEKQVNVLHGLAWNLALLDMREDALRIFDEIVQIEPNYKQVHVSLQWLQSVWDVRPLLCERANN
ncbi:tetratricopeptide repeat protein [Halalkalibacter urbisdiaboli]|uniref:tetratricopeptide repeat protein n=1 Tax=Halalkalibacter urbisdiaboli TaxID=1960589 RepID=UPI000B43921F|nr:hypothetical protein [Halalkalibacter urbisdiaboli]